MVLLELMDKSLLFGLPEEVGTTGLTCMINSVVGQHYFDADPDPDFHADV